MRFACSASFIPGTQSIAPKERLIDWAKRTEKLRGNGVYLISAGQHWLVIKGHNIVCGIDKTVRHYTNSCKARCHVTQCMHLTATEEYGCTPELDVPTKYVDKQASERRKSKIIMKRHGIEYWRERSDYGYLYWFKITNEQCAILEEHDLGGLTHATDWVDAYELLCEWDEAFKAAQAN